MLNKLASIKRWLSRDIGQYYEEVAVKYLKNQGLERIEANFNCRYGELDIIMADADVVVFVEVKYRRSKGFGGAIAAVSRAKQRKLVKTAQYYMQCHQLSNKPARFDVIAINGDGDDNIQWIKNAFYAG